MSTAVPGQRDLASTAGPPPELAGRLGYLLKHAQLGLAELTAAALEPFGLTGRELAVLTVLSSGERTPRTGAGTSWSPPRRAAPGCTRQARRRRRPRAASSHH